MIPTLHTARLTLRPFVRADFDAYAAFMASPRAAHMGGPIDTEKAWGWFANDIASWALYGFGNLAIEVYGAFAGGTGLTHPAHFPEVECGWFLCDGYEGRGFATEGTAAVLAHAFATTDLSSVVSYVGHANTASAAVARRIGGTVDMQAATPNGDDILVFRHTAASLSAARIPGAA